eukprot:gene25146-28427_t
MVSRFRKWEAETLLAAVQSSRISAGASSSADQFSGNHPQHSISGSVSSTPVNGGMSSAALASGPIVAVSALPSPLHREETYPEGFTASLGTGLATAHNLPAISTAQNLNAYTSNSQSARHFRTESVFGEIQA